MANPSLRAVSRQIEGVNLLPTMDMIPFQGGMDVIHEIYQLPLAAFSNIQNFRPLHPGFIKRKGCSELNTTADGILKVLSAYMFSKGKQSELHTYAQMSDGHLHELNVNPPTPSASAFGTAVHVTADIATMLPISYATINDFLYITDGTEEPRVYSGNNEYVSNFMIYKGEGGQQGLDMPLSGEDYSTDVANDDVTLFAVLSNISTMGALNCVYIRTQTPADAFNITMVSGSVNGNASVAALAYWNGAWTPRTINSNTTISPTGTTLGQTGTISWTMTTDHIPRSMYGASGYWYRLSFSAALSSNVKISTVTYNSKFVAIQNVWNGVPISAIEAYVYDDSAKTYSFYAGSGIDIGLLASADKFYFNSYDQVIGFYVSVGATPNTTAATTILVKYWNGVEFHPFDVAVIDGTMQDSKSFAQDGWVTWTRPTDEQPSMFQSSMYYSHWYEVSFNTVFPTDIVVSIETMPYYQMKDFGKVYSQCAFKNRLVLGCEKLPGNIAISGAASPLHLNGADFAIQDVGDGRSNKVICIKRFYNEMLVWQEEKGTDGGCLTLIEGYSPATFGKRVLSTRHGTFSSKSAVVVEDVPIKLVKDETPRKVTVAYFLSRDGIFRTDGLYVERISTAVQDYFDPKSALCITRGKEKEHWIDYDSTYQIVRVGLVTGISGTLPNVFLVYDIYTGAWSYDVLGQPLSCHCEVESTDGQFLLLQIGGGTADGTIYLLNNTTSDNGLAITASATMEFDGNGHNLHIEEIVIRASGALTVTPTWDGTVNPSITIS